MKRKKQAKTELSIETWAKLRRLVEAGKIRNIATGIAQAVEEFVEKFEKG